MKALTLDIRQAWILAIALAVFTAGGCANYGGTPESPEESFALAATLIETGYDVVRIGVTSSKITRSKGVELRNSLVEAENALRVAEAAYRAGREFDQSVFATARAVLSTVRAAVR